MRSPILSRRVQPAQPEESCRSIDTEPVVATRRKRRERGNALIELTLIAPWLLFLFVGVVDMGFFTYSLIAVENAARIGAEYTSGSSVLAADQANACIKVRKELAMLPSVAGLANCSGPTLTVTAVYLPTGPDLKPATSVSVTYQGIGLIPIPGLLTGRLTFTRNVQMRVKP
jgi:Flp pilus assembly protein TadG